VLSALRPEDLENRWVLRYALERAISARVGRESLLATRAWRGSSPSDGASCSTTNADRREGIQGGARGVTDCRD
jgi:hypothetical protein